MQRFQAWLCRSGLFNADTPPLVAYLSWRPSVAAPVCEASGGHGGPPLQNITPANHNAREASFRYTANSNLFRNKIAKLLKEQLLLTFRPSNSRWNTACQTPPRGHALPVIEIERIPEKYVNSRKNKSSRVPQVR